MELSENCKFEFNLIPFPKKLFSLIPPPTVPPEVPKPAPKEISPVGFSSTLRFTTLSPSLDPGTISISTFEKIFFALILFTDLLNKISL